MIFFFYCHNDDLAKVSKRGWAFSVSVLMIIALMGLVRILPLVILENVEANKLNIKDRKVTLWKLITLVMPA